MPFRKNNMSSIRIAIYNALVNKKPGIAYRYHKIHDGSSGILKLISWLYLLWLNFAYYVLFCRFLGERPEMEYFEQKKPPVNMSESEFARKDLPGTGDPVEAVASILETYDIISFDVFDTLIFRPLCQPKDLFYFIGEKLSIPDFRNIRAWAERDARMKCYHRTGHTEVSFSDIWENFEKETGVTAKEGMRIEETTEKNLCYANPFMLEVWNRLKKAGKRIIVISDMYLPTETITDIIESNGFTGAEKIFVSNAYGKNKSKGDLFEYVKSEVGRDKKIIHIGDNPKSDVTMAARAGFATIHYPQVNRYMMMYRPYDMSYIIGSAYRGIVSNYIYNGLNQYSMEYEYGFIYGGLFVLGYCGFIHEQYINKKLDKLLFLSRDGEILKKAYDYLYPDDNTEYAYLSRKAATKLMAGENKHDYFRRFIYHKINQKYRISDILKSMELEFLTEQLSDWRDIWQAWNDELKKTAHNPADMKKIKFTDLTPNDELTDKNAPLLRRFIESKWDQVMDYYEEQRNAGEKYYKEILNGCRKAAAIDIGWAGSGAIALMHLAEKVWNIPCEITGIIAGTNTVHNAEPDAAETFLQTGRLLSYMYSQSHNRDLLKLHDPGKDYNVYFELLLASPTPQFIGFYSDGLRFGKKDIDPDKAREIQAGIMDFVKEYTTRFKAYPYMLNISGRDAYAPIVVASGNNRKYLKSMVKRLGININVD